MKSFSHFFSLFFHFFILFELISCNKNQIKTNDLEGNTTTEIIYDSLEIEESYPYSLPSLEELVEKSPILNKEGFGSQEEEIRFITGQIIVLSLDENLIYMELLPKTSEDNTYHIQMIFQNLNDNTIKAIKQWEINNESGEEIILLDFFKNNEKTIVEILGKENSKALQSRIAFKPYIEIKDVNIVPKFQNLKDASEELNLLKQVQINFRDSKTVSLEQNSKNPFCSICNELPIYKADFLGEMLIEEKDIKILVIGFLEQINHAPSALHVRFLKNEMK